MKNAMSAILLSFMVSQGFARTPVPAASGKPNKVKRVVRPVAKPEVKADIPSEVKAGVTVGDQKVFSSGQPIEKYLVTFDYNSWFEKLTVTSPTGIQQESQALYYGFGIGGEKNWYQPTWGWGLGGGIIAGSAVGGDKAGALTYYQARVPWWALKVAPRLFYRWTPRTDFGLDVAAIYKKATWPSGSNTAKSGSDFIPGAFMDMRVRFNPKLEMIQSFGMVYKDTSIYWRLGLAYRL
jgi:hypothetical protein